MAKLLVRGNLLHLPRPPAREPGTAVLPVPLPTTVTQALSPPLGPPDPPCGSKPGSEEGVATSNRDRTRCPQCQQVDTGRKMSSCWWGSCFIHLREDQVAQPAHTPSPPSSCLQASLAGSPLPQALQSPAVRSFLPFKCPALNKPPVTTRLPYQARWSSYWLTCLLPVFCAPLWAELYPLQRCAQVLPLHLCL